MNVHKKNQQKIDRQWIETHIPHQGLMCLLDHVERWDEQGIVCIAHSHADIKNPLRSGSNMDSSNLGITTAIEYAAQATAVHSALLMGDGAKLSSGFLTSARNVQWRGSWLDNVATELSIHATRLSGDAMTVLYAFEIVADTQKLIDGRISIFLNSNAAASLSNQFERSSP
jgi:predicted hotdog family 3-hydroxylacyl-ACP dehydratase